jgi:nickel transport protein
MLDGDWSSDVCSSDLAEGRLRFNDIAGGIGMIVGLAGAGLWAAARRRDTKGGGA